MVEPTAERLANLGLADWPKEAPCWQPTAGSVLEAPDVGSRGSRVAHPLRHFRAEIEERNSRLRDLGYEPVRKEELRASRLYTGPMYTKYNSVLREIGKQRTEAAEGARPREAAQLELRSNTYTTTLHVLNSAIAKLKNLTPAATVYRGISQRQLPASFKVKNEFNTRGGVEFGFISCSLSRDEVMRYVKAGSATSAILIEMTMGIIDRAR